MRKKKKKISYTEFVCVTRTTFRLLITVASNFFTSMLLKVLKTKENGLERSGSRRGMNPFYFNWFFPGRNTQYNRNYFLSQQTTKSSESETGLYICS